MTESRILEGVALGFALSGIVATLMIGAPVATRYVAQPVISQPASRDLVEMDCSGVPHKTLRGDTIILFGGDDSATVYLGENRQEVDIRGMECSFSRPVKSE